MIESKKGQAVTKQKTNVQSHQPLKGQLLQNLKKQSSLSHTHNKDQVSEIDTKPNHTESITEKSTINRNLVTKVNIFRQESNNKQTEEFKSSNNEFMDEEEISNKIMLNDYFSASSKAINQIKCDLTAKNYLQRIEQSVSENINQGIVRISKHQEEIKNLLVEFKLSSEELKIMQMRAQTQAKHKKFMLLDPFQQLRKQRLKPKQDQAGSLQKIVDNYVTNAVLSKEEHKRLIQRFKLSNKTNQQKKKQRLFQLQQRQRSLSNQKLIAQEERLKKQRQFRKISIQQKLVKRKKNHESFILQQKMSTQKYREMKTKKKLYENMQEKYRSQILIPSLEEKKMKLKEIRDFNKKYDITEIKKHQLEYLEKKSQSSSKYNSRHRISTFHYNPPQRSKKMTQLLEEQKFRAKMKFDEKKRMVQENKIKQVNFLSDIKIKFKPKIDETKREEIQKRLKSQQAQNAKSVQRDPKLLGMKYFQDAKKFIKKQNKQKTQVEDGKLNGQKIDKRSQNTTKQKTQGNEFPQRQDYQNQFINVQIRHNPSSSRPQKRLNMSYSQNTSHKINLHEQKRKQIRKIINSNDLQREVKLQRLKMQNEKINQIYKRREKFFRENENDQKTRQEAVGLLLNSIHTKMGIIDLCTKS